SSLCSLQRCVSHLVLHSFPTRRSSDLKLSRSVCISPSWDKTSVCSETSSLLLAFHVPTSSSTCPTLLLSVSARALASSNFSAILDRKSTRLNSSHVSISYAVFCLKKKT